MRYTHEHKAETHQRIVAEAALRFRRDGIDATGVQTLMKALGLTHGAFYAHFASKHALVEEVLRSAGDAPENPTAEIFAGENPIPEFIEAYLSVGHRDAPETGCPLTTLSLELGRSGHASPETDRLVVDRAELLAGELRATDADDASVAMLATLVGALVLSRSVVDRDLADRILDASKRWLSKRASS